MFNKGSKNSQDEEIQRLLKHIQVLTNEKIALNERIQDLTQDKNKLVEENKSAGYQQVSRQNDESANSDFYAGVIDIPNLRALPKGWDVHIRDWTEYQQLVKKKGTLITVVGNYSKGKTFLFELLSDLKTPHGFNVNTQGISIVYLKDEVNADTIPIIGLDTKGGSLPLDISALKFDDRDDKIEEDTLKEILRDHEATEDILQNFILEEASIIIVMVADLTFDDQKLVNKIKKKFKNDGSKKIIVVHNLYHTHYLLDVEYKIKEFIRRSFILDEVKFKEIIPDRNRNYYVDASSKFLIPHVILAKQNTEAGNYYNDMTIKYIRECINTNDNAKSIDIVESFHRYLQKSLPTYLKTEPELKFEDIKLVKDDDGQPKSIIMGERDKLQMKAVFADEFGHLHIFKDGFQPNYSLFEEIVSDEEKYIVLKIECPDSCSSVKSRIWQTTNEFKIQVKGMKEDKKQPKCETIADTRHFGEFFVETDTYKKSRYNFDYRLKPDVEYIDGMAKLKWRLLPSDEDDGWTDNNIKGGF